MANSTFGLGQALGQDSATIQRDRIHENPHPPATYPIQSNPSQALIIFHKSFSKQPQGHLRPFCMCYRKLSAYTGKQNAAELPFVYFAYFPPPPPPPPSCTNQIIKVVRPSTFPAVIRTECSFNSTLDVSKQHETPDLNNTPLETTKHTY